LVSALAKTCFAVIVADRSSVVPSVGLFREEGEREREREREREK
jgi:hypothetical protein